MKHQIWMNGELAVDCDEELVPFVYDGSVRALFCPRCRSVAVTGRAVYDCTVSYVNGKLVTYQ